MVQTQVLSKSTPVTTAFALAVCGGAFWLGGVTNNLTTRMNHVEHEQADHDDLLEKLSEIATDNKRRIDLFSSKYPVSSNP